MLSSGRHWAPLLLFEEERLPLPEEEQAVLTKEVLPAKREAGKGSRRRKGAFSHTIGSPASVEVGVGGFAQPGELFR